MKKSILAICDAEESYVRRLSDVLSQKSMFPFQIQASSDPEQLKVFADDQPIEILLIGGTSLNPEVERIPQGKLILLSDGSVPQEKETYPVVYKYQSASRILREVMACYSESDHAVLPSVTRKELEIIGIYSPVGRTLKTTFAITLGQILSEENHTLYLNLEEYSGLQERLGLDFQENLADLIYFLRQEKPNLIYRITGMVQKIGSLDYIPPMLSVMDLREISYREWEYLLDELILYSGYEKIVIDFGLSVDNLFHILNLCGKIYMPVRDDPVSSSKIEQYEKLLTLADQEELLAKTVKLNFPVFPTISSRGCPPEQLAHSELGEYVRELLKEGNTWTQ